MTRQPRPLIWDAVVGSVIGLCTWPIGSLQPYAIGLDPSWVVALHLAARSGLAYGSDIVFTYGPLGFLGYPQPYLAWTSALALAFTGGVHLAACIGMFHLARQATGAPIAAVLVGASALVLAPIDGWHLFGVLLFVAAVAAVLRRQDRPTGILFAVGLGIAIGVAGLGKLNVAVVAGVIAGVAVVASGRAWPRSLAAFTASAAAAFLLLWLALSQDLAQLLDYARGGLEVALGYSRAMALGDPRSDWESGVVLLVTLIVVGLVWHRSRDLSGRERLCVALLFTVMLFGEAKADFVRDRFGDYLATLLVVWPLVIPATRSLVSAGTPVAAMLAALLAVGPTPLAALIDPMGHVGAAAQQAVTVLTDRSQTAATTEAWFRSQYQLPPAALALLAGHAVQIEPWDAAVAYAYPEIQWHPLPVFQAYDAYTPYLDALDAASLAKDDGPDRMLWLTPDDAPLSIDGRSVWFDSPAAKIQMLCRYTVLASAPSWQVLGRTADRCGPPITVETITTTAGTTVPIPSFLPPGIVTLRVLGAADDLRSQLVSWLYRTPAWWLTSGSARSRLVIGTADEPNVIGAEPGGGFAGPLRLDPPQLTVAVGPDPGATGVGSPITLVFQVIPVMTSP